MKKDPALPSGIFEKGRWYYKVHAEGKKRVWVKLTPLRHGLPTLFRKLADIAEHDVVSGRVAALAADWLIEVSSVRESKTQANDRWMVRTVTKSFAEFLAEDVTPPDVADFLRQFRDKPRKHNEMRSGLRELMRFAEEKGFRTAGTNPDRKSVV